MKNQSKIGENKENYRGGKMVQGKDCGDGRKHQRRKIPYPNSHHIKEAHRKKRGLVLSFHVFH